MAGKGLGWTLQRNVSAAWLSAKGFARFPFPLMSHHIFSTIFVLCDITASVCNPAGGRAGDYDSSLENWLATAHSDSNSPDPWPPNPGP